MTTTLNLIWQTKPGVQTEFELEYIKLLFQKLGVSYHFDHSSLKTIKDHSVIIYSDDGRGASPEFIHYLNQFVKLGYRFYLLHLSNENLRHDCWYYSKANYVFRNYFDPKIKNGNVLFIPLGFQGGYLNKGHLLNDCADKTIDVAFAGQPKTDRFEMIAEIEKLKSYYIHKTNYWNNTTGLSIDECIEIYKKTKYAPCPMGSIHPDSFRVCETLEWGCIPVVKKFRGKDYFQHIFGSHPFKVIDQWSEIADIVKEENYCHDRESVHKWYLNFKDELQLKIKNIIDSGGVEPSGRAFKVKNTISELRLSYRSFIKSLSK